MGLFGRLGCNAGACHGSFQGKNGFRLSLFGYDPAKDHAALTRDVYGRRINPVDPDRSLLLLKATGQVAHGGGRRFSRGSWQYRMLREWIATGARWNKGQGAVAELTVSPGEFATIEPGKIGRVSVQARFADGSKEDITPLCDIRAQDDAVAEVVESGVIKAIRPGDTALVVSYRGNVRAIRVLVPMPAERVFRYPDLPTTSYIDREVFAKLRRLNMVPSELAGDAEFLRRVTIDTIGSLPSPDEVRTFVADKSPDKRARKIDALLAHPLHAALWATKLSDITGNNTTLLRAPARTAQAKVSQMWHDWLRKRIADNMPYDEIVKGMLCATSRDGRSLDEWMKEIKELDEALQSGFAHTYSRKKTLDLFWQVGKAATLEQLGERTASAFLGVRLECAQCHKHPFDRWTQTDYRAYANIFGRVTVGASPDTYHALGITQAKGKGQPAPVKGKPKVQLPKGSGLLNEVYVNRGGKAGRFLPDPDFVPIVKAVVINPKGKKNAILLNPPTPLAPKALGGPVIPNEPGRDAREALFEWMRSPENPFFARSFVNRIWGHYFGVGVVDPVDNFSLANPPSNARLLDALAADFVARKFDIRAMERLILNSRVYQLSSTMNETNKLDRNNFAHSYVRPMMAEVVVDVLNAALGVTENFGPEAPAGSRAIEIGASRVTSPDLGFVFRIFGRPDRNVTCECERDMEPSLPQTLYLMTDPTVQNKLRATLASRVTGPKVKGQPLAVYQETRLTKLLKSGKSDAEILDELFLATLSRSPSTAEKKHFADYLAAQIARPAAADHTAKDKLVEEPQKKKKGQDSPKTNKGQPPPVKVVSRREAAFIDALWALINTREFILNH
jgi:hypothetical protein